jgi:hypothetical protein
MRNTPFTEENDYKRASSAPRCGQQVQWRSLAAAVALISIFIAAPLSRWHIAEFESSNATATAARIKSSAGSSEVLAPATRPETATATAISNTSINRLCSEILGSAWRGEPLPEQSRAFLEQECQ